MKILYIYPFYGELGWEIANWRPHVASVLARHGPFERRIAHVQNGHEGLYNGIIDEFLAFDGNENYAQGNTFLAECGEFRAAYQRHQARCDREVYSLRERGHTIVCVRVPEPPLVYRYEKFEAVDCPTTPIPPCAATVNHWSEQVDAKTVVFHFRSLKRSPEKNTDPSIVHAAHNWTKTHGCKLVVVGRSHAPPSGLPGLNLFNQTTVADLIAIMSICSMVVGSSSGPMHLAASTRTPHVVWGGGRDEIRLRYLEAWNPLNTPVHFLATEWKISPDLCCEAMTRLSIQAANHPSRGTPCVPTYLEGSPLNSSA